MKTRPTGVFVRNRMHERYPVRRMIGAAVQGHANRSAPQLSNDAAPGMPAKAGIYDFPLHQW